MKKLFHSLLLISAVLAVGGVMLYAFWPAQTATDYFTSGKSYYDEGKYPEAIIEFLNALQRDSRHRDARNFLAQSYLAQRNLGAAAKELKFLLEYYPEDTKADIQLGNIYLEAGNGNPAFARAAREIADKVLINEPQNVQALILRGNSLAGLQDYQASLSQLEEALRLDPQNAGVYVSMGSIKALQKNYPEAESAYLKALEADPQNRNALLALAGYYSSIGKVDNAAAMIDQAVSRYPADKGIYVQAALYYYQAGRFEQAEKTLRDAQNKNP